MLTYDKSIQGDIENHPDYHIQDIAYIGVYCIPEKIDIMGKKTTIDPTPYLPHNANIEGWMQIGIHEDEEWECTIDADEIPDIDDITIKDTWLHPEELWGMNAIIIEYKGKEYKARNYPEAWDNRIPLTNRA